ncbi:glycosyltransferase family 4 protein [Chryseobacterium sp.]|uniref:glycosyltransferase family 4 protein n=1 Tax=Chryseobacterium sp. TaxID=1871047 RepID=UPI0024E23700|nr:glycosyltransferase family 4 protein [Chryseobacterium sp.]
MEKKKVLHVISISFVINHFFGNQFAYFNKKGYKFFVACSEDDKLFQYSKEKDFTPFPVPIVRSIEPIQDIKSIYKLYKFIKKEKFDIVVAHSPKGGLIGMIAAFLAGTKKRVFFRHGLVFETTTGAKRMLMIWVEKLTALLANKIVNVSRSIMDESNKLRLNNPEKNLLLGRGTCNGIDVLKFKPRNKNNTNFVVGYVGRLSVDKGIVELVEAWEDFSTNNTNVELHLIGPYDSRDPLPDETVKLIEDLDSIIHTGLVEDTSKHYNEMDVFILPSYREGFGMVILEASASGIPVITTRKTGCINAIVEDETGIFTDINASSITESLQYYFDNPSVRKQHGQQGVEFVNDFFTENILFDEIEKKVL